MPRQKVTLRAKLATGIFYWVTEVEFDDETEAIQEAERRFLSELDECEEWHFSEYQVDLGYWGRRVHDLLYP